jgi:hypothetical protein
LIHLCICSSHTVYHYHFLTVGQTQTNIYCYSMEGTGNICVGAAADSKTSSAIGNQTKTVTLQVTFSKSPPTVSVPGANNDDQNNNLLHNIEICHVADWNILYCNAVWGKEAESYSSGVDPPHIPPSRCKKSLQMLLLLTTHFIVFMIAYMMCKVDCTLKYALMRSSRTDSNKNRLPPSTSLIRIQDPLSSYSEGWQPVPVAYSKTIYADFMKQSHPFLRALHDRGYFRVGDFEKARILYSHTTRPRWAKELELWQRFNYIPGQEEWKDAYKFHYHYKHWEQQTSLSPASVYIPPTYLLTHYDKTNAKTSDSKNFDGNAFVGSRSKYDYNTHLVKKDITAFQQVLKEADPNTSKESRDEDRQQQDSSFLPQTFWLIKTHDSNDHHQAWGQVSDHEVLVRLANDKLTDLLDQGKKYNELNDQSNLNDESGTSDETTKERGDIGQRPDKKQTSRAFIQKYICDQYTLDSSYGFKIRVFWAVMSLEPLIVMYHDGYIDAYQSDQSTFSQSAETKTIHTDKEWMGMPPLFQLSFAEFETHLNRNVQQSFPAGSPTQHVRSQMKEALADMIFVLQTKAFNLPDGVSLTAENAFSLYCADFLLDQSLDVWLASQPKSGCNLDEDYYFRLDLHASMFQGMIDIMEQVWERQENKELVMPLQRMENWEILYGDGLRFKYDGYDPSSRQERRKHNCLGVPSTVTSGT